MQHCLNDFLVAGVAALLVLACRGSETTPPESPAGYGGTDVTGSGGSDSVDSGGSDSVGSGGTHSADVNISSINGSIGSTGGTTGATGATQGEASGTPTASGGSGGTNPISMAGGCGKVTVDVSKVDHARSGRIVVLGSSTAEGKNASSPDNGWVARYEAYLAAEFPNFALDNLAIGGFNTYRIQPSDYVPPDGRPLPKSGNNITAALEQAPDAVIINLPSNDEYEGFSLAEQMDNYERVTELAEDSGVLVWVATPQPRNFDADEQRQNLMDARDAIQQRFAPLAIDFWTDLANPDGTIGSNYNSGDGKHLNDAGHAVLSQLVSTCAIPEVILTSGK